MLSVLQAALPAFDTLMFIVAPYVVLAIFFLMTIRRYASDRFSYSTRSSQFLENRHHFWGSVPWHIGILALLAGHLIAFVMPDTLLAWNSVPLRLYAAELGGLIFAFVTFIGLLNLIIRRLTDARVRAVTGKMDILLLALLLFQVVSGMYVALSARWGSSWFAAVISPYLKSLFLFSPDISALSQLPWSVKIHIIGAWAIFALFPFTRLVHVLVIPNPYIWRRPQVVIWNRWESKP